MARRRPRDDDDDIIDPLDRWRGQEIQIHPDHLTEDEFAELCGVSIAELRERKRFIEEISLGTDPLLAGLGCGWSISKSKRIAAEMHELVLAAQNIGDLRIAQVVVDLAHRGVEWAVKLYLYNRRPDLYKDVRHLEVKHSNELPAHVLQATRDEVRAAVEATIRRGGVAELQRPAIETTATDEDSALAG